MSLSLRQEIERLQRTVNGCVYWSAMDLYRFLGFNNWRDFEKRVLNLNCTSAPNAPAHILKHVVNGVVDYWMTPEAIFLLLSKLEDERPRTVFAINYFVQYLMDKQKSRETVKQIQSKAIDKTKTTNKRAEQFENLFKVLTQKNKILVKKSTDLPMLSDWFTPALIVTLNKLTGNNFLEEIDMILSTYLDMLKTRKADFGFSDEAIGRLSYEINAAFSAFYGYVADEETKDGAKLHVWNRS